MTQIKDKKELKRGAWEQGTICSTHPLGALLKKPGLYTALLEIL